MSIFGENVAFVDELYTWRVPIASAVANGVSLGFAKCSGLIVIAMQEQGFQLSSHLVLMSMAFNVSLMGILSPLVNLLTQRLSARLVSLTGCSVGFLSLLLSSQCLNSYTHLLVIGLSLSTGAALVFSPPLLLNGVCFDRYRTRAAGLCFAGESLGCILMPILITFLIDEYSVRGALLILSGLYLNLIPTSIILPTIVVSKDSGEVLAKQSMICGDCDEHEDDESDEEERLTSAPSPAPRPVGKKYPAPILSIIGYVVSLLLINFAYFNQLTIYPLLSNSNGVEIEQVSLAMTVYGIIEFASRVGCSFICELMSPFSKVILFGTIMGILGIFAHLITVFVGSLPFLFMYVIVLGLAGGVAGVTWTVLVTNLVGVANSQRSLSFILLAMNLFTFILLCTMTPIREAIGSYTWVIRIGGISAFLATLLHFITVAPMIRNLNTKTQI